MDKTYRINELFYTLQGEGRHTGRAAVFVRMSRCNLRCPFCDTDFQAFEELTASELLRRMEPWKACRFVVITGGEPTLQADAALLRQLHEAGWTTIAMESNGTRPAPEGVDWLTVSPKCDYTTGASLAQQTAQEVKVVFDGQHPVSDYGLQAQYYYLQPCDTGDATRNRQITAQCVDYIKAHPKWQLSLQTHKLIDIP